MAKEYSSRVNTVNTDLTRLARKQFVVIALILSEGLNCLCFYCKQGALILGSGESHSWRGSLRECCGDTNIHTEQPHMQMDSYLGRINTTVTTDSLMGVKQAAMIH